MNRANRVIRFCCPPLVLAALVLVLAHAPAAHANPPRRSPAGATTWTVITNTDDGAGSLREALQHAGPGDTILFVPSLFSPIVPLTISLSSPLPAITQDGLTVDAGDSGVVLDGSGAGGAMTAGLDLRANDVSIHGLRIVGFSGNAVEIRGQGNLIGGDPTLGTNPLGQGNMLSGNGQSGIALFGSDTYSNAIAGNLVGAGADGVTEYGNGRDGIHINAAHGNLVHANQIVANGASGIYMCCSTTAGHNVIEGNWIGTDPLGSLALGNALHGVWLDLYPNHNTIGRNNLIALNDQYGVTVNGVDAVGNTVTGNQVYSNAFGGISLENGGNTELPAPYIWDFDLASGQAAGSACSGCWVEVFSDDGGQGRTFEGSVQADADGAYAFNQGSPFAHAHLTATATDSGGNTSPFSPPTQGSGLEMVLQPGNGSPKLPIVLKRPNEMADNRIGLHFSNLWGLTIGDTVEREICSLGGTRFRLSVQEIETPIDWTKPELTLEAGHNAFITDVVTCGISPTYILSFWDKANHSSGWSGITSRFRTQEEITRFEEFLTAMVPRLAGRIGSYELWNEPDNDTDPVQYIEPQDYVDMAKTVAPLIRQIDPDARIVVGSTTYLRNPLSYAYMLELVQSDLMPVVDVVAWHPMYGASPQYPDHRDYYYDYADIVRSLKTEAISHGFTGEFCAAEITWRSPACPGEAPEDPLYTNVTAGKYYARGIVINRGLDLEVYVAGMGSGCRPSFTAVQNLATTMAGATVLTFPVEVQTTITRVVSYTFGYGDGGRLLAVWNDDIAVDEDAGITATLRLPGIAGWQAEGFDVLHSYGQSLQVTEEGSVLVIPDVRLRDYPLLVRLTEDRSVYLPTTLKETKS